MIQGNRQEGKYGPLMGKEESFYADMYSKMNRVGNGFKMGRWEVGFLQVGAWVFIGGCLVVNLVHEEL